MAISFPIVFLIAAALFFASSASAPRVNIISFVFAGKTANHGNAAIVPTLDVAMSSARQRYPSMFGSAVWISKAAPFNGSNIAPCDISEDAAIAESLAELYESGSLGRNLSTAGLTVLLTPGSYVSSLELSEKVYRYCVKRSIANPAAILSCTAVGSGVNKSKPLYFLSLSLFSPVLTASHHATTALTFFR